MKRITVFCILALLVSTACCAQSNQTESLTFVTYYPTPSGVFRAMRFYPNNSFSPDGDCAREGDTSFHGNTHELYVCKGSPLKWKKLGSGAGLNSLKVFSDHGAFGSAGNNELFSPDQCGGINGTSDSYNDPLCSEPFYMDIVFNESFSSPPHVIVAAEHFNSWLNQCAFRDNDMIAAFATNVTTTGFRLWAGGSPEDADNNCDGSLGQNYSGYYTQAIVSWMAIGE